MDLLKFKLWESLYESKQTQHEIVMKIKKSFGVKWHGVYYIPDFNMITNQDGTVLVRNLISDKELNTVSLNFTKSGTLHSLDFWKPDSTKPVSSLDASNMSDSEVDKIIETLPDLIKNSGTGVKESIDEKLKISGKASPITLESPEKFKEVTTDKKAAEIDKDLAEYKYGDPKTIFADLRRYTKMVIKGDQAALLITGSPGVGKSFIVNDEIKKAGLIKEKEWIKVKGKTTAAGMYISLFINNGKLIIFDDCDSIFKDDNALNILKGALDSSEEEREISWGSAKGVKDPATGEQIPSKFNFNGRVIFISNKPQKGIDTAIKSRAFVLEVALSPKDMVKYVEDLMPNVMPEEPMSLKRSALNTIKSVAAKNNKVQLNMRTLIKSVKILKNVDDLDDAKRMIIQQCSYE